MERTLDLETFPSPAGARRRVRRGCCGRRRPDTGRGAKLDSIAVDGNSSPSRWPSCSRTCPTGRVPGNGLIPADKATDPAENSRRPLSTGPYKIADYTPKEALTLVRNDQWTRDRPGSHGVPRRRRVRLTVPSERIDEVLLNDQGDAANTMTFDDILGTDDRKFQEQAADRLVPGPTPCTRYSGAGLTARSTDINIVRRSCWPTRPVR